MVRVWIGLVFVTLGFASFAQAQHVRDRSSQDLTLTLPTFQLGFPKVAPAVEIGGAIEDGHIETIEGPRKQKSQWFLGAFWRHIWMPKPIRDIFSDQSPILSTGMLDFIDDTVDPNVGVVMTYRNKNGFSVVFGLGYASYEFEGPFRPIEDDRQNTEWIVSDLSLLHATGAALWSTQLHDTFAIEYGFGLDLGITFGDINRTEAVWQDGEWSACERAGIPNTRYDEDDPDALYCEFPTDPDDDSDDGDRMGAHYDVDVGKWSDGGGIPNVIPIPMIPMIAFRYSPVEEIVIKLEAAFGIIEFWAGISLHAALWTDSEETALAPELRVVDKPEAQPLPPAMGRIRGSIIDRDTELMVPGATVSISGHPEIQSVQSRDDGTFITEPIQPGVVIMDLKHPDYSSSSCEATIPEKGGEVERRCSMVPLAKTGVILGKVLGPSGPLDGVSIVLSGPESKTLTSDNWGNFKVEKALPGDYQARVSKEGFIDKMTQFTVKARETLKPEVTLVEKPKLTMVKVEKKEIKIERKIHFSTASAKIKQESYPLMNEIASVFKSYSEIKLVEIQGHTDSRGSDKYNQKLSEDRAASVRNWLISAGVEPERMSSKGYGESLPIDSNRSRSGRAANRRVQFIILKRDDEPR